MEGLIKRGAKAIVCGGRGFKNAGYLNRQLSTFHAHTPIGLLIEGGAPGADELARNWAKTNNVPFKTYNADWENFGRAAGPIRNKQMITENSPEYCISFPGGKGTANMIKQAESAGVCVIKF